MKIKTIISMLTLIFLLACATVPITGRKQFTIIPASEINAMSFTQYDEFLKTNKVIRGTADAEMVKRVGVKIQKAVERYFAQQNLSGELAGYAWEFNLVQDEQVNAWCMPGGKVVVYTGILPVTGDENGLAVVMGHEIGHAIAEHGNERMSQGLLVQMGGIALSKAIEQKPQETQNLFMTAYGLGAQVGVILPYSRSHENEADHIGLIIMAMAGYDPNHAVEFWQRMAANSGGQAPPEFLSTHPSDQKRIDNLKKLLPEALKHYKK
ncbi:MAG: M48 family metallopeptidase [Calditrichaceae bacterium]|nr:M48 family metallopeptidase [Calditrichaceae bacterium]MBN2710228.1 M48 family metallopeptidase [Calditrichaceae bacterium]RQV96601.1 MAG: M48 family peptidase [Calditrichota bacterium]